MPSAYDRIARAPRRGREAAQAAALVWALAVVCSVLFNASRPWRRDIGGGVGGDCGHVFASQIPQIAIGGAGALLLLVAALRGTVRPVVLILAGVLLIGWIVAAVVVPGSYAWDCVN